MKNIAVIIFLLSGSLGTVKAQPVHIDSLYRALDAALDSSDMFLNRKDERIALRKEALRQALTNEERFECTKQLYEEYAPFNNDSAIAYQYQCIDLAERMGNAALRDKTTLQLVEQLVNSGFYNEARQHLESVSTAALDPALKQEYHQRNMRLYAEMAYYTQDSRLKMQYQQKEREQREALIALIDTTSTEWIQMQAIELNNSGRHDEALAYSDRWLEKCRPGTREYATMAFFRGEIFHGKGDIEMYRYWLIQSALIDVRNAIMDQSSLWSLANNLKDNGEDLNRAQRYIDFSWTCLTRFSTHMRAWLVAPVVTEINNEYKQQLQTTNNRLVWMMAAVSILFVGLLWMLTYVWKKRRQLDVARNELRQANSELSQANALMQSANEQLSQVVVHLDDSNRVKEEYIGKFLSICSEYIDKMDNYRLMVNRKLKTNQYADLLRMTETDQLKENELKNLLDNFDNVFLRLFPTFIDDFNSLLKPEARVVPTEKSRLNTDLRIFALIRLGIDESSKIAEFLHYSPNSIYSYRARIKNKAAGNRDDFENRVRELGIKQV